MLEGIKAFVFTLSSVEDAGFVLFSGEHRYKFPNKGFHFNSVKYLCYSEDAIIQNSNVMNLFDLKDKIF